MDRIYRDSQVVEGVRFGSLQIPSLLFADDVVLLASANNDLQLSQGMFGAKFEVAGTSIITSKSEAMVLPEKDGSSTTSLERVAPPSGGVQVSRCLIHK